MDETPVTEYIPGGGVGGGGGGGWATPEAANPKSVKKRPRNSTFG